MTEVITVVFGAFVPTQRNIDLRQRGIVVEQTVAQSFQTVGKFHPAQIGTLSKGISLQPLQTVVEGHILQ